jgi:orotidine-5'-phosphate decarboxylase
MRNPIIVALDLPSPTQALNLARTVAAHVGAFKVGKELFVTAGPEILRALRETGASVFLDLKFHDIPNTVAKAVAAAVRHDVQMLTVHASGGAAMLQAAQQAAAETANSLGRPVPLILAVTVLTSMDETTLQSTGCPSSIKDQVLRLAQLASGAGLSGLVCSPLEIALLRSHLPRSVQLVTPGIRSPGAPPDDQHRTMGASEALTAGADWLVIGRPIYAAKDPAAAATLILEECRSKG